MLVGLAVVVAGCSTTPPSASEQLAAVCADVHDKVEAIPAIDPEEDNYDTAPKLDRERDAARDAEKLLRGAASGAGKRYDGFLTRWHRLVVRFGESARTFHGEGLEDYPGSDTVNALRIAGVTDDLDAARHAVDDAANRAGLTECAKVPWKYWKS